MGTCWHCGSGIEGNNYHRQDSCTNCKRDTHVCKNCFFYDRAFNNDCKESSADRVVEKERSNFCDFFKPGTPASAGAKSTNDLKSAAEALFRKK